MYESIKKRRKKIKDYILEIFLLIFPTLLLITIIGLIINLSLKEDHEMTQYIGKYEKELVNKAYKYAIPIQNINGQIEWEKLRDDIEDREKMFKKAERLGIDFIEYLDEPITLEQLIEEEEKLEFNYKRDLINYYYSTRGC